MTLLLTGATGFLGRALLPLLAQRDDVVALHRPGTDPPDVGHLDGGHPDGAAPPEAGRVRWVAQDLAAPLSEQLPARIDGVLHVAQSRRYREFPDGALDVMDVNTMATTRLLDYCRRAGGATFVYASTGAVSGAGRKAIREDDPPAPGNLYAISKHAGEQVVAQYRPLFCAHSLRYFFIYGPGQEGMMMPGIIGRVASGQEVQLAGADGISLNPVYAGDAARATAAALELDESATINVAGPETVSIRQIAEIIGGEAGKAPTFENVAEQPDFVASIDLMTSLLGAPTTTPREGLARMVAAG
ncbi:MAG: NAD(P)-dependent oxidoreductase [Solirubrobacterales bacterium]|nr:NAD(P)-dependent oxidoreductase [Solirubrobacterales bacterium]